MYSDTYKFTMIKTKKQTKSKVFLEKLVANRDVFFRDAF